MEIQPLTADPDIVRMVAEWHQAQWGHLSRRTAKDRMTEFEEHFDRSTIPLTLLAWEGSQPIGSASLLVADMDARPNLTPWLGSVLVLPEHRGKGVGSALVKAIEGEALRLGEQTLYLFTPDRESLYQQMGWETTEVLIYHGEEETLMTKHLRG